MSSPQTNPRLTAALVLKNARNDGFISHVTGQSLVDIDTDTIALTSLQKLDVSDNALTSLTSLRIPSLTTLKAAHNKIKRLQVVGEFLAALKSLDVSFNPVKQLSLSGCPNLTALIISNAKLRELGDSLKAVPRLQTLVVSFNRLTSLAGVQHLHALTALSASHNQLNNAIFDTILALGNLKKLRLNGNQAVSALPARIAALHLELLDVGNCTLATLRSAQACQSLTRLKTLNLKGNPLCSAPLYEQFCESLPLSITSLDSHKRSVDSIVPFNQFEADIAADDDDDTADSARDIDGLLAPRAVSPTVTAATEQRKRSAAVVEPVATDGKRRALPVTLEALTKKPTLDTW